MHLQSNVHNITGGSIPPIVPHHNDALHDFVRAERLDVGEERAEPCRRVEEGEDDRDLMVFRIKQRPVAFKAVPVESQSGDHRGEGSIVDHHDTNQMSIQTPICGLVRHACTPRGHSTRRVHANRTPFCSLAGGSYKRLAPCRLAIGHPLGFGNAEPFDLLGHRAVQVIEMRCRR